jgi:hypothetical protein
MVFLHGTVIMQQSASGRTRKERVRQVIDHEKSVLDFANYVPVEDAVSKLHVWHAQGAKVIYLSSHRTNKPAATDKTVLANYHFPEGEVFFRQKGECYPGIVERIMPDILIEDDCESIGGEIEMVYPHLAPEMKKRIKSIVVKEFGGIDHLPDHLPDLINY